MFSYFKKSEKNLLREVYFSVLSRVIKTDRGDTCLYMPRKKIKSMGISLLFFKSFRGKYKLKNILGEMKNGLTLRQQQLKVIMY